MLATSCAGPVLDPSIDGDRPPRRLGPPDAEWPAPFGSIRAALGLPDGRVVVSDPQESRLVLVDFSSGQSTALARIGAGPREFRKPGGLYRAAGGGILVFDQLQMRLLPIEADGRVGEFIPLPAGGIASGWTTRGPDPLAFDSLGQTYLSRGKGRLYAPANVVLRFAPGDPPDTVAELRARETKRQERRRGNMGTYLERLFSAEDAWAVAPDGWIAVVRAEPYRVEWMRPDGGWVTGPEIHHEPIPVAPAERELIAGGGGGWQGRATVRLVLIGPGGPPPSSGPKAERVPVGDLWFAKVKTPVNLRDGRWPLVDAAGRVWVERSLPFEADVATFDVFDRVGGLVDRVALPRGAHLVGFGQDWLFASRRDADDLHYLQRFRVSE